LLSPAGNDETVLEPDRLSEEVYLTNLMEQSGYFSAKIINKNG
jgi:hypothetical protein